MPRKKPRTESPGLSAATFETIIRICKTGVETALLESRHRFERSESAARTTVEALERRFEIAEGAERRIRTYAAALRLAGRPGEAAAALINVRDLLAAPSAPSRAASKGQVGEALKLIDEALAEKQEPPFGGPHPNLPDLVREAVRLGKIQAVFRAKDLERVLGIKNAGPLLSGYAMRNRAGNAEVWERVRKGRYRLPGEDVQGQRTQELLRELLRRTDAAEGREGETAERAAGAEETQPAPAGGRTT